MVTEFELIGVWSNDALHGPGAQSDEMLIFLADGLGRAETWNFSLCEVIHFRWALTGPASITLNSTIYVYDKRTDVAAGVSSDASLDDIDRFEHQPCDQFRLVDHPVRIDSETLYDGRQIRALHIDLGRFWPSEYGLHQHGVEGWEQPRWQSP
jgi:hypothetical protein